MHNVTVVTGDAAAMLSIGWSWKRVLLLQILSQLPAFLGLYIGIPVGDSSDEAQEWFLMIATGIFLYVALCDLVPQILEYFRIYPFKIMALCVNLGLAFGFLSMFWLAIFEEHIDV